MMGLRANMASAGRIAAIVASAIVDAAFAAFRFSKTETEAFEAFNNF